MKITPQGFAILDLDDPASKACQDCGRLDYDQNTLSQILKHIDPGMVVVDGGAFIGDHTTAYLNAVGKIGSVHAFECNPIALECLRHNCPMATIYPYALSDSNKRESYKIVSNIQRSYLVPNNDGDILVECIRLDSVQFGRVDVIKLDLEGWEYAAILGAFETLRKHRPKLIVEISADHLARNGKKPSDVLELIESFNYKIEPLMPGTTVNDVKWDALCTPIRSITFITLCAGKSDRFGGQEKRMLVVDGETLYQRRVRQFGEPIPITRELIGETRCTCDTLLKSRHLWIGDRIIVLLGDVFYTDEIAKRIIESTEPIVFWTDCQDIFAFAFNRDKADEIVAAAREVVGENPTHNIGRIWELFRKLRKLPNWHPLPPDDKSLLAIVSDETQDFDTPEEYEAFKNKQFKNRQLTQAT